MDCTYRKKGIWIFTFFHSPPLPLPQYQGLLLLHISCSARGFPQSLSSPNRCRNIISQCHRGCRWWPPAQGEACSCIWFSSLYSSSVAGCGWPIGQVSQSLDSHRRTSVSRDVCIRIYNFPMVFLFSPILLWWWLPRRTPEAKLPWRSLVLFWLHALVSSIAKLQTPKMCHLQWRGLCRWPPSSAASTLLRTGTGSCCLKAPRKTENTGIVLIPKMSLNPLQRGAHAGVTGFKHWFKK